jgi:acyl transferase domain-containing protein
MPSLEAQAALIKYVYESNGLDYSSTQYVEAHVSGRYITHRIFANNSSRVLAPKPEIQSKPRQFTARLGKARPKSGRYG